jgi:hypothetical protein
MRRPLSSRALVASLSALVVTATTMMIGGGTASADTPWAGALCKAAERIQFYTSPGGAQSYEVAAHNYIRVVYVQDWRWAYGHGENHSDRWFIWQHSNGIDRLYYCHNT